MRSFAVSDHSRAALLRRDFDAAFALPPPASTIATEDFLAIRVGEDAYAIRVSNIARLIAAPKIIPLPSKRPAVLGVAAIRGALVSVHSLPTLLGHPASISHRWLTLVESRDMIALAFDDLDGFLRLPKGADGAIEANGITRSILDVRAVLEMITGKAGSPRRDS